MIRRSMMLLNIRVCMIKREKLEALGTLGCIEV
jgi:hypothetical protein